MSDVSGIVVPPPVEPTLEKAWSRLEDVELSIRSVADHVRGDMGENAPSLTTLDNRLGAVEAGLGTTQTSLSSLTGRVNEMDGWIRRVAFPFFQSQPGRDSAANTNTPPRRRSTDRQRWQEGSDMAKAIAAALVVVGGLAVIIFAIIGLVHWARSDGNPPTTAPNAVVKYGTAAELFKVEGTPAGWHYDGVSSPKKAGLCGEKYHGTLVKSNSCRKLGNGQVECKDQCRLPNGQMIGSLSW